jgi:hypothetical protein
VPSVESLQTLREAATDATYVSLGTRRTASPHEFYRYPARLSPAFAEAAIEAFSSPGDMILDPYVGGGTTVVAAQALGRFGVGSDINPLATFVTKVKTTSYTASQLDELRQWSSTIQQRLILRTSVDLPIEWRNGGYLKNLGSPEVWRIRSVIALALQAVRDLRGPEIEAFARCGILRTGQWALDMTARAPSVAEFRSALKSNLDGMIEVAEQCRVSGSTQPDVRLATVGLPGLRESGLVASEKGPALVLTSPPYPGVYVLYHRWKVLGRRESPAPYWIAASVDGNGMSHYTMGNRLEIGLHTYFVNLKASFQELAAIAHSDTWFVQIVGFREADTHLPRYLEALEQAGLQEVRFEELATGPDGRLWRAVPNRRWWTQTSATQDRTKQTAREVVLIHRVANRLGRTNHRD